MKALTELTKDALELAPPQRFALARILLELSEEDQDYSAEVELAWDQEIARRMQAVREGKVSSRSLDEVLADLDRRFA
jgi:hypothetical protein